jgi:hypothetical protein
MQKCKYQFCDKQIEQEYCNEDCKKAQELLLKNYGDKDGKIKKQRNEVEK